MADIKSIAEELVNPTANETKRLITILRDEYGIKPAAAKLRAIRVITKY